MEFDINTKWRSECRKENKKPKRKKNSFDKAHNTCDAIERKFLYIFNSNIDCNNVHGTIVRKSSGDNCIEWFFFFSCAPKWINNNKNKWISPVLWKIWRMPSIGWAMKYHKTFSMISWATWIYSVTSMWIRCHRRCPKTVADRVHRAMMSTWKCIRRVKWTRSRLATTWITMQNVKLQRWQHLRHRHHVHHK